MTMTDPVADMLTRLRNANSAHHDSVTLPSSKLKTHIAEILQQEGYIAGWETSDARVGKNLTLTLKYGPNRERSIAGIKRVSKPGLRVREVHRDPHGPRRPRRGHPVHLLRSPHGPPG